jgi:DNA polymerase-1
MTLLVIDGDHQVYRASASCGATKAKPEVEPVEVAIFRFNDMMSRLLHKYGDNYELYIGGQGNWRYVLYPEYKSNRSNVPKPIWFNEVREHAVVQWKARLVNDIEVDDECGIRLTQENEQGNPAVLVSLDKDLKTVPGRHYNFVKDIEETVSPIQALRYFYGQVITGDQSDHVPAFDGKFRSSVPQFVQTYLNPLQEMKEEKEMYDHCCEVYQQHGCWGDEWLDILHRNASVLFIQKEYEQRWQPPGHQADSKLG